MQVKFLQKSALPSEFCVKRRVLSRRRGNVPLFGLPLDGRMGVKVPAFGKSAACRRQEGWNFEYFKKANKTLDMTV